MDFCRVFQRATRLPLLLKPLSSPYGSPQSDTGGSKLPRSSSTCTLSSLSTSPPSSHATFLPNDVPPCRSSNGHVAYRRTTSLPGCRGEQQPPPPPLLNGLAATATVAEPTPPLGSSTEADRTAVLSLLNYLALYNVDPKYRDRIYREVLHRLQLQQKALPSLDKALPGVDGTAAAAAAADSVRVQFLRDPFHRGAAGAAQLPALPAVIDPQLQFPFWPTSIPRPLSDSAISAFTQARFATNFVQLGLLGRGGFGKVFHVQNVLDQQHYAVKCVKLKHFTPEKGLLAMREVNAIAQFDHPNIIRYYSAWLELEVAGRSPPAARTGRGGRLAIMGPAASTTASMSSGNISVGSSASLQRPPPSTGYTVPLAWSAAHPSPHYNGHSATTASTGFPANGYHRRLPSVKSEGSFDIQFGVGSSSSEFSIHGYPASNSVSSGTGTDTDTGNDDCLSSDHSMCGYHQSSEPSEHSVCGYQSDNEDTAGDNVNGAMDDDVINDTASLSFRPSTSPERRGEIVIQTRVARKHKSPSHCAKRAVVPFGAVNASDCAVGGAALADVDSVDAADVIGFALGSSDDSEPELVNNGGQRRILLYIQMQVCDVTLLDWLVRRNDPTTALGNFVGEVGVDEAESWRLFMEMLEGINHIHNQGLMHRDLKPANIFLHGQGQQVKIGDFGLAREDVVLSDCSSDVVVTPLEELNVCLAPVQRGPHGQPTAGVGTSTYASPEQLEGRPYDSKSDMFSLGLILMELFSPFTTTMERIRCMRDARKGTVPTYMRSKFPKQSSLVLQLLSKDPNDRPDSRSLLKSIKNAQTGLSVRELQQQLTAKDKIISSLTSEVERLRQQIVDQAATIACLQARQPAI